MDKNGVAKANVLMVFAALPASALVYGPDKRTYGGAGGTSLDIGSSQLRSMPGDGEVGALDRKFATAARFDKALIGESSNFVATTKNSGLGGLCFVAGTPVSTEKGKKPIDNVKVGDRVWATDPNTHKSSYHKVTVRLSMTRTTSWKSSPPTARRSTARPRIRSGST